MTDWKTLGPRVRALRLQLDISMDDAAIKAGVSKATVSRFERGFDTTFHAVVAICAVVGLNFVVPQCQHEYVCRFCGEEVINRG